MSKINPSTKLRTRNQKLTIFLTFITLFLISSSSVYAARTLSITSNKTSLFGDEEMAVTASMSGFTNGETIYIKGAFFQSGSTNYFGYTKSSDTWIKNSTENASQRSVKIGEWDGNVIVKSDFSDSGYKGEGDYSFKVRFYYGSSFTADWSSNVLTLAINEPDPTPTLSSTPTNVPTSVPTPTKNPVPSATVKPQSTSTPIKIVSTATNIPSLTVTSVQSATSFASSPVLTSASESAVLGETTHNGKKEKKNTNVFSILLIILGSICVAVASILSYRQIKKSRMRS